MDKKAIELHSAIRRAIKALDSCTIGDMNGVDTAHQILKDANVQVNIHLGRNDLSDQPVETMEWYAGQILDVIENKAWFAVNSIINCVDKFCPMSLVENHSPNE